jgi:hypothetical protein
MGDNLSAVDLGSSVTVIAIAAGGFHTCALLSSGAVKCWGYNFTGALGSGNWSNDIGDQPGEMGANLPAVDLGSGVTATAIAAGQFHTCALLSSGAVKCWGENGDGQLGLGDTNSRGDGANEMGDNLLTVDLGSGVTATAIVGGHLHTCALLSTGTVTCWGDDAVAQLGQGAGVTYDNRGDGPGEMGSSLVAVNLGSGVTATAIAAGAYHTCALLSRGAVKCWGENWDGQLGLGDSPDRRGYTPRRMGDGLPLAYGFVQTISFTPSDRLLSYTPFSMSVSSDSGLAVSLVSSTLDVCTASGVQVTMVAAGVCTLTASQVGDSYHLPATSVTRSFTIAKNPQKISFGALKNKVLSTKSFAVEVSSDSGLMVSLKSSTSKICTVWGLLVTMVADGVCTLTAGQAGDSYYLPGTSVQSFAVSLPVPVMKVDSQASLASITKRAKVYVPKGAKVSGVVVNSSKKYCKMLGSKIVALSPGLCKVTLTIDPKGPTKTTKRISVKISR